MELFYLFLAWNVSGNTDRPATEGRFINSSILAVYHNEPRYYGSCLRAQVCSHVPLLRSSFVLYKNTRVDRQPLEMRSCIILTSHRIIADITSSPECETLTVRLKTPQVDWLQSKRTEDKCTSNADSLTFITFISMRWDLETRLFYRRVIIAKPYAEIVTYNVNNGSKRRKYTHSTSEIDVF